MFFSWVALLYSLSLTGLGFQTGWTQWLCWYRGRTLARREFTPRGVYHLLRHPVCLSFLGLLWFTPVMTLDRAVLTGIWTFYIGVGSVMKDQRLLFCLGDSYRRYMENVPGYPLIAAGPLARRSRHPELSSPVSSNTIAMPIPDQVSSPQSMSAQSFRAA